jgi:hypothetical protein
MSINYPDSLSSCPIESSIPSPEEFLLRADQFAFGSVSRQNRAQKISDILNLHRPKVTPLEVLKHRNVSLFFPKDGCSLKEISIAW